MEEIVFIGSPSVKLYRILARVTKKTTTTFVFRTLLIRGALCRAAFTNALAMIARLCGGAARLGATRTARLGVVPIAKANNLRRNELWSFSL